MIWIIAIYLLSILRSYFWFKNAYSKGGTWSHTNADLGSLLFTFCPLANTLFSIITTFDSVSGKEDGGLNLNGLFRVKK
jgi:hypothetical protein